MNTDQKIDTLTKTFKGIFTMPISHSTYRELQNVILQNVDGKVDVYNSILDSLLKGELTDVCQGLFANGQGEKMKKLIEDYCIPARYAKAVFERGDFINLLSSDFINQNNQLVLVNNIRLVDGKEIRFLSDIASTLSLIKHFLGRLTELQKGDKSKTLYKDFEADIRDIKEKTNSLSN